MVEDWSLLKYSCYFGLGITFAFWLQTILSINSLVLALNEVFEGEFTQREVVPVELVEDIPTFATLKKVSDNFY